MKKNIRIKTIICFTFICIFIVLNSYSQERLSEPEKKKLADFPDIKLYEELQAREKNFYFLIYELLNIEEIVDYKIRFERKRHLDLIKEKKKNEIIDKLNEDEIRLHGIIDRNKKLKEEIKSVLESKRSELERNLEADEIQESEGRKIESKQEIIRGLERRFFEFENRMQSMEEELQTILKEKEKIHERVELREIQKKINQEQKVLNRLQDRIKADKRIFLKSIRSKIQMGDFVDPEQLGLIKQKINSGEINTYFLEIILSKMDIFSTIYKDGDLGKFSSIEIYKKYINGQDGRQEICNTNDEKKKRNAKFVAALFKKKKLENKVGTKTKLPRRVYGDFDKFCNVEKFQGQPDGAFATGFLVKEDVILMCWFSVKWKNRL